MRKFGRFAGFFLFFAAAVRALGGTAFAAPDSYTIYVENQYDENMTSSEDNKKEKLHPIEPRFYSEDYDIIDGPFWSVKPLNWKPGGKVTGRLYVDMDTSQAYTAKKDAVKFTVVDGQEEEDPIESFLRRNEVKTLSTKRYTGDDYEGSVYEIRFSYQVAAKLGEPTSADWDENTPGLARWSSVPFAGAYELHLFDDSGMVCSVESSGESSYNFAPYMDKKAPYYYEVRAIAQNGDQRKYLKDGEMTRSKPSTSTEPGITEGRWADFQEGRRYLMPDGSFLRDGWKLVHHNWYFFNADGYLKENGGKP